LVKLAKPIRSNVPAIMVPDFDVRGDGNAIKIEADPDVNYVQTEWDERA
jgi:hypothetical protein